MIQLAFASTLLRWLTSTHTAAPAMQVCGRTVCQGTQYCTAELICCNSGEVACAGRCCGAGYTCLQGQYCSPLGTVPDDQSTCLQGIAAATCSIAPCAVHCNTNEPCSQYVVTSKTCHSNRCCRDTVGWKSSHAHSPQPLASATCRRACMHTATQRYMISSYCSMRNDGNLAICCYVPFVLAGSTVCGGSVCQSPQQCAGEQGAVLCFWSAVKSANHGAATSHNSTTYYLLQPRWCWSGCSSRRIYKHVPVIHSCVHP